MIAAALLAASVLAPSGVTATIQADPVCLNVPTQPGTVYDLPVYATGSGPLSVGDPGARQPGAQPAPGAPVVGAARPSRHRGIPGIAPCCS